MSIEKQCTGPHYTCGRPRERGVRDTLIIQVFVASQAIQSRSLWLLLSSQIFQVPPVQQTSSLCKSDWQSQELGASITQSQPRTRGGALPWRFGQSAGLVLGRTVSTGLGCWPAGLLSAFSFSFITFPQRIIDSWSLWVRLLPSIKQRL